MIIDEEVYLEHFGVKGMKWGVRNVEKGSVGETKEVKGKRKLSSKQKKILIGTAAVAAILATYIGYSAIQSGEMNRQIAIGKAFLNKSDGPRWNKNQELSKHDMSSDEILSKVVKHINPNYGAHGTKTNCRRATFAYEMRRRGYDVSATTSRSGSGQGPAGMLNAISPGKKILPTSNARILGKVLKEQTHTLGKENYLAKTPLQDSLRLLGRGGMNKIESIHKTDRGYLPVESITKALSTQPNGARGELAVVWRGGGGHSLAWEILKGKPVIFDAQNGKRYLTHELVDNFGDSIKKAGFTRLDDLKLNEDFLQRWLKNAA